MALFSNQLLAKEIATVDSTVSDPDVLAVFNDLTRVLAKYLVEGRILKFGDFGNFQLTLEGQGVESVEKFIASHIIGNKIQFCPGTYFRDMLAMLKYEKYTK
ncbi:MAG: DNA-binding protein [Candidatus Absconditicoccaceae bacterium]